MAQKNHNYGKNLSEETRQKISQIKGMAIYLYSLDLNLIECFTSSQKAAKYFGSNNSTILKYARSGAVFKKKYILSLKEFPATLSEPSVS